MRNEKLGMILRRVTLLVENQGYEYIVPEMILWCVISDERFVEIAKFCNAKVDKIRDGLAQFLSKIERVEKPADIAVTKEYERTILNASLLADKIFSDTDIEHLLFSMLKNGEDSFGSYILRKNGITEEKLEDFLSREMSKVEQGSFFTSLTGLAESGKLDPMIGRKKELGRVIQILHKKRSCNPLIVSEPGVGKTALVEGLAMAMCRGDVPDSLKGKKILSLDLAALVAGSKMRGELEEKLKSFLDKIVSDGDSIVFIDEIHMMAGAGSTGDGSISISGILKPYLTDSSLRVIGATTYDDYRKCIQRDQAMARRFKKIDLAEPSREETLEMLMGLRKRYEDFHGVKFPKSVLEEIIDLSADHLKDQFFPDKAIEVMDEIGSQYSSGMRSGSKVTSKDIEDVICAIANIDEIRPRDSSKEILKSLAGNIKLKLFGQDEIVDKITGHIKAARAGLTSKTKPMGVFGLVGPTGCGKTELVKQVAENLHMKMLRFDMSEYSEKHTVSKLIGAPPGYIGFDQAGALTEAIRKNPESVVLFDEIEKANESIYDLLLQIMDEGRLTDSNGRTSDFTSSIVFMTSNVGSRAAESAKPSMGFMGEKKSEEVLEESLKDTFAPEFRNRFTGIYRFNSLGRDQINLILDKELRALDDKLKEHKIKVTITPEVREKIVESTIEENMGGRPVERLVNMSIAEKLVDMILFDGLTDSTVSFDVIDGEISIKSTKPKRQGKISGSRGRKDEQEVEDRCRVSARASQEDGKGRS